MSSGGDLRDALLHKARDLFSLCDPEGKGFATKDNLENLRGEVPLPPQQLHLVFDALDTNGDGQLTLQEFTDGFGIFLGIDTLPSSHCDATEADGWKHEEDDDDEMLEELLDHLGATNLFTDEEYVREMWRRVRKEDPVMRSNFENFISKMAADLKDSARERDQLQMTLKNRREDHETQVQSLYVEMEEQLRREREKIMQQEHRKEQRLKDDLESELQLKDLQLKDLLEKHAQMESQLSELNAIDSGTKHENNKLQKDRDVLESKLSASERMLQEMKCQLTLLRKKSLEEKRKRAQAALKVSEGIALEREDLVLELHRLKEVNKQLQDENDELTLGTLQMMTTAASKPKAPHQNIKTSTNDVNNSKNNSSSETESVQENYPNHTEDEIHYRKSSLERKQTKDHPLSRKYSLEQRSDPVRSSSLRSVEMENEDPDPNIRNNLNSPQGGKSKGTKYDGPNTPTRSKSRSNSTASSPRNTALQRKLTKRKSVLEDAAPTRVFKVVFVGDSGVGKTSILQRFCTDSFKSTFSATIGVDFQVKTVEVDGERIALQLWDTAGQERFRSMTHQYFRKADGIMVVYDVTSEISFRNVRNWMHNIQEGAQEGVLIVLLGNKVDLCESENDRVVKTKDGARLADEYGSLFFETSAKTGDSICMAIEALASMLKTKEDEAIEQVLKLQEIEIEKRKRKCC